MKKYETGVITSIKEISAGIIDMSVKASMTSLCLPGQFVMIYPNDKSTLLPRPISICEIDKAKEELRFVFRVVGKGTAEFSTMKTGDSVRLLGPAGNGFPLDRAEGKNAVLIGGGIGVPPILELSKQVKAKKVSTLLGYRNNDLFLKDDFDKYSDVYIATEDGSVGTKGNVLDCLKSQDIPCDVIMACGPMPMLRAIKAFAEERGIEAYISLEERMACGVGACLGCVCKTTNKDHHSHVNNARVCTEGPVFEAREVEI